MDVLGIVGKKRIKIHKVCCYPCSIVEATNHLRTNTILEPTYEIALPDYEEITLEKESTAEDVKITKNEAYDFIPCGFVSMTECPAYQSRICADL